MIEEFVDDDVAYLQWVANNPEGFVVNCDRQPRAGYLKLHRATCYTIIGNPARGERWTTLYRKVCSLSRQELEKWSNKNVGGLLSSCELCNP